MLRTAEDQRKISEAWGPGRRSTRARAHCEYTRANSLLFGNLLPASSRMAVHHPPLDILRRSYLRAYSKGGMAGGGVTEWQWFVIDGMARFGIGRCPVPETGAAADA